MSLAATIPAAILDTILGRLAFLFLTGAQGDLAQARDAARQMLAAYHPETEPELHLAAEIISFSAHALEALAQAATPDMPLAKILRLRGSAVSLSRESHKSQRKLDQLQAARRNGLPAPAQSETAPYRHQVDKAIALIEATRDAIETANKPGGAVSWTRGYQQRQTAKRLAEKIRKNHAKNLAAHNASIAGVAPASIQTPA